MAEQSINYLALFSQGADQFVGVFWGVMSGVGKSPATNENYSHSYFLPTLLTQTPTVFVELSVNPQNLSQGSSR